MSTTRRDSPEEPRVVHRPDGYYVVSADGDLGPFATAAEALEAIGTESDEEAPSQGETLEEAEAEIGVSGWVDPESGELAEDSVPRIEEH